MRRSYEPDDPNDAQTYMIQKFRIRFKLVLAFSPVGDTFRIRARRFPGLINCTAIDYFPTLAAPGARICS